MQKPQVKGELFIKTHAFILKKWGMERAKKIGLDQSFYKPEAWYPLEEFCAVFASIAGVMGGEAANHAYIIGHTTMLSDVRFAFLFKDKDPKEGFNSSRNQTKVQQTGDFKGSSESSNSISVYTNVWTADDKTADIWSEFYRGRSQGVLDLTGKKGKVEKITDFSGSEKVVTYEIRWF
jgi:hypothetical protein